MSTVVTRAVKGSPLTYAEMDANFDNLNTDKLQSPLSADLAMGGNKVTGSGAATANGDLVRYEQLPSASNLLPIASGGTASGSASAARTALAVVGTAGDNLTGGLNGALTTVASHATTADIFATSVGNLIDWTGTATTTDFADAPQAGVERTLVCAGAAVFTAGANMLIDGLTTGQSYTASAGDKVIVRAVTTTQFRLTIQRYVVATGTFLQAVEASYSTVTSTAANIPIDSTIPQIGEGLEILTASITPSSSTNRLRIEVSLPMIDASTASVLIGALFQDATANALATGVSYCAAVGQTTNMSFTHEMAAGTTSATTFRIRVGAATGTMYVNQRNSGSTLGGATAVRLRVTEVKA